MASRMIASSLVRSLRRYPAVASRSFATRPAFAFAQVQALPKRSTFAPRFYSAPAGLSKETVTERIVDVLKSFEKVDQAKLTPASSFAEDLGLDSLDAVEVVMAIEEEFAIEIPDAEADEIKTVKEAIEYILKTPEAH